MKIILWAVVLGFSWLLHIQSAAQSCTYTLQGKILDETGAAMPGATIRTGDAVVTTDAAGQFVFHDVCPGVRTIEVEYVGYEKTKRTINVPESPLEIRLETSTENLQEVVVEDKRVQVDYAQNVSTLTAKQLAETAGKTLGESLREITGVNSIQAGPGIFKPVIHGVHSQRILILNYGIRQEGQQWGAEHAPEIDPFIAANISVVKDASAIKYGTDALGGVVIVNPPDLPETAGLHGSVHTVLQSNGRSGTISGMLEGGIGKHTGWGWRIQGTGKRAGDFQTPHYSLTNTALSELNFSSAIGYHQKDYGVELFASRFQTALGILKGTAVNSQSDLWEAMERSVPLYTSGFSYSISEPRQAVVHNLIKLKGHLETDKGVWHTQYGFQNNGRQEYNQRVGVSSSTPTIDLQLNTHTWDTEFETSNLRNLTLCMGVNGMWQKNSNVFGTKRIPFIPNFTSISGGAYFVAKITHEAWVVDIGTRYDYRHYDVAGFDTNNALYKASQAYHNPSATAGVTLYGKHNQTVIVNISSAWRSPNVAELYSSGTHQSVASNEYGLLVNDSSGTARVKTEQAFKFVSTYQKKWNKVQVEASPYANYIANFIYLRPTGFTTGVNGTRPTFKYWQTDALFLGVDFSAIWQVLPHVQVIPKASLLRASDVRNNDYLINIPSNRYEVAVRYDRPAMLSFTDVYVESRVKFVEHQGRAPRVIEPSAFRQAAENGQDVLQGDATIFDFRAAPDGYWLWNIAAGASVRGKKMRYDFRVTSENTLNTVYREYTNRFRYYSDELGRNVTLSFKCIF